MANQSAKTIEKNNRLYLKYSLIASIIALV